MDRFARWLARRPLPALVATALVTVLLGIPASHLRIENSLESVLPAGDPAVEYYNQTRATFGSDDVAVVGVLADDVFAPTTLEKIARVTTALGKVDGVEWVVSITNAVDPAANPGFTPPRLLPHIPPTPEELEALKQRLAAAPILGDNVLSRDYRGAAINVFFKNLTDAQYVDLRIDERIAAILAEAGGPERFFYTGAGHIKQAAVAMMRHDLVRFTPIALVLILVVLWLSFRTVRGVTLPILAVSIALVWTLGVIVLAGKAISLGTSILPPLLLVVGSSYAIHVMARYYEQVAEGGDVERVLVRAYQRVWLPLTISAVVTMIGFGSLMVNRITAIWDLGLFAVVGIACLAVTCLVFLPAALAFFPLELRSERSGKVSPVLGDSLARLGVWAFGSRRKILWGAVVVGAIALVGARLIHVDADYLYYFPPGSQVRVANETINREIVGSGIFNVVIEGGGPGVLRRWEVLKLVKDLQSFLATLPGVTSSMSLVDYLELIDSGVRRSGAEDLVVDEHGNLVPAPAPKSFWQEPRNLEALFDTVARSPDTFKGVVTRDFSRGNILVRTNLSGSRRVEETLAKVRAYIAEHFPAEIPTRLTGLLVLMSGTTTDIVAGQIESLTTALVIIFAVMAIMFLSAKVGFLAIMPNVLPIVLFFGVMGWLGIYLDIGTSLIAAIALGIAVDSTIHYMARFNLELRGETDQSAAIVRTLRTVGVPIVYTTVALFFGFLTFGFSNFVPIQNFGVLAGVTMVASLGANVIFLPALLAGTKIITIWDLLGVKLGDEPARTIPLFAGLRPAQARIVALMGELRRFAPGDTIVRRGEEGNEMYVIIKGATEVWAGSGTERRQIAGHRRGDVFGEMGLVRHNERSADVVAASEVEVLAVDERFLDRIQRRYPRIASKVFLNLTRILSDRLEAMNAQVVARRQA